ncbi:MAG TPA: dipeptide epimerase [Dermatophilaceae bacterium]|nr:dipeptide epimerase [Dermatophilaceae bacterium]HPZ70216.1 dipeptide epimerase [Dermatophilaceae bacterium]HQD02976.1 dipeptide epimerase [Dermatophilaceae bacterium]
MARIRAVRSSVLSIPLHTPFVTALRRTSTIDTLIVCLDLADGTTGLGEAPQVWAVTGDSVASATACVEQVLAPVLVGADSDDWDALAAGVARACARNFGAKAAVETALLDAVARAAGMPLAHLFADVAGVPRRVSRGVGLGGGAAGVFEVATDVTISAGSPEALRSAAQARVAEGFTRLKLKVGTDAATDVARVRAVREAAGPDIGVRLDANQGWSREDAVAVIRALAEADLGVEIVEQPVAGDDVEGLAWVRERVDLPIMADETVYGATDLERVIRLEAADAVNVKLAKCGGPLTGLRLLARAREAGLGTMVGSMMESHVGVATAASMVAAVGTSAVSDLDAAWWATHSPYAGGPTYGPGVIQLPDALGLGMSLA